MNSPPKKSKKGLLFDCYNDNIQDINMKNIYYKYLYAQP